MVEEDFKSGAKKIFGIRLTALDSTGGIEGFYIIGVKKTEDCTQNDTKLVFFAA